MVSIDIPAPLSPTAALFNELINYPDSPVPEPGRVDTSPTKGSYASTAGLNVDYVAKTTKMDEKKLDEPFRPTLNMSAEDTFPTLPLSSKEAGKDGKERSPSVEIIDKPASWKTPTRAMTSNGAGTTMTRVGTPVKQEAVSPDLSARITGDDVQQAATPPAPTSGLGKHDREDAPTPTPASRVSFKKRRVRKSKQRDGSQGTVTPTPNTQSTLMSKSPSEAMLWDSLLSPSSSAINAIDDSLSSRGGPAPPLAAPMPIVGERDCDDCRKTVKSIEAGWTDLVENGPKLRQSIIDADQSNLISRVVAKKNQSHDTSTPTLTAEMNQGPPPIYPCFSNAINATIPSHDDVIMRSPSPSITQILRDRIPRHEKGKDADRPAAGPSRPVRVLDSFYPPQLPESRYRALPPFNPDDTTCSVYPPPQHFATSASARTPVNPSSLIDRYQLFESTMASRGPPISRTLYASEFPTQMYNPPQQTPLPPRPYVEDGELVDDRDQDVSSLRDFVQQQAENAPAELDDFLTIMPPPVGGFPPVYFTTPLGAYSNIMDRQLLDWERERRSGLVTLGVSFYGFGALDGDVDPRHRQLLSYAAHTLNARFHTDRIMIAKPQPKVPVTQLNAAPHTALLYGLRTDEAEVLEQEGVMCTTRLAMFFHKLDVAYPEYVGAIHGLTTRLIQPVYEMVLNHFLSPEAETLFRNLACRPPNPLVLPQDAQSHFVNTMYVRRLDCRARGNTHAPVFQVYMRSPATDYHSFREWSAFCRKMNLVHSLYGRGHLKSPGICAGCHGHDHPSGLCRFAKLEGWLAPAPNTPPNFSIPMPQATDPLQGQGRATTANSSQARPRRRRGNGRSNHVDTPRP